MRGLTGRPTPRTWLLVGALAIVVIVALLVMYGGDGGAGSPGGGY